MPSSKGKGKPKKGKPKATAEPEPPRRVPLARVQEICAAFTHLKVTVPSDTVCVFAGACHVVPVRK